MVRQRKSLPLIFRIILIIVIIAAGAGGYYVIRDLLQPETVGEEDSMPDFIDSSSGADIGTTAADGEDGEPGLTIHLSEGQAQPQTALPITQVAGEPLTDAEIAAILNRLPQLQGETGDHLAFRLPEDVLPPPLPGETIEQDFPPAPEIIEPAPIESGPLQVLRFSPEGVIPVAPFLSITFNQPMVPLGTLSQLSEETIPVEITPELPGTWRWVGTRTLTFQYESDLIDRLPMSTIFTATIPAGIQSTTGGELAESIQWTFSTPPPQMTTSYPTYDPQPLDPIIFIAFDQHIDSGKVLEKISATADNRPFEIRLATEDEISENKQISNLVSSHLDGRWLAIIPKSELPADSVINIVVEDGTPSAEGPLVTEQDQSFSFQTYAPLKIEEHGCSWYGSDCYPLSPFYIRFNNPIDPDKFEESMIKIDPELPDATVSIYGNSLNIQGPTQGSTTYRVTVDASITDIFGQQLGRSEKLTFRVGKAEPVLVGPEKTFITMDPAAVEPEFSVYSINYNKLEVEVYQVEPSDWPAFKEYLQQFYRTDKPPVPPGKLVLDDTIKVEAPNDKLTEVKIDLSKLLQGEFGHFIVKVKPPTNLFQEDRYWETIQAWVQITQIGLDAFADHSEMIAWTTDLQTGAPLEGVTIQSNTGRLDIATGPDGVARFDLPNDGIIYLTAQKGEDLSMLPRSESYWGEDSWYPRTVNDTLRWYVIDDRAMYKPGEEVHVKGWMRLVGGKQDGNVGLIGNTVRNVTYQVIGAQGNEITNGTAAVNTLGGFDLMFDLPENANLGYAQLNITASGLPGRIDNARYYHSFQIQEFRRPEFEVTARNETTGPYFAGEEAVVAVKAEYYAGGPLPNAEVNWEVSCSSTTYQPPNWPDFSFGSWTPWWYEPWGWDSDTSYEYFSGETDATGNHYLEISFDQRGEPSPYRINAQATVMDVNRQAWAGSTNLLVHPADLYVGMRSERYFVERNTPLVIDLIVTDLDGNPVVDRPISVTAERLQWKFQKGSWKEVAVDTQTCTVGSQEEPVSCTFETPMGGRYRITATITDAQGRANQSQFTRWVTGGQQPPSREVEQESVELIPDKETYQPGDVAEILVISPFSPAEGLLTVTRSGILYTERFEIENASTTLKIPIKEEHIPNLNIQVDVVGSSPRMDDQGEVLEDVPARPAYATNSLNLSIPPLERTLQVEAVPRSTELEPGGRTTIDVALKDVNNNPIQDAELAVIVVDEAILALTSYQLPDPVSIFYYNRPSDLASTYNRSSIVLVDPRLLAERVQETASQALEKAEFAVEEEAAMDMAEAPMAAPMATSAVEGMNMTGRGAGEEGPTPIQVRSDFNPLAIFSPSVRTNADGTATVEVKLPDNLTRYRVMVIAVDEGGSQFGTAEANITARLPLMVRPSASRFLNFGDQFEVPVVLQNQTDEVMTVDIVAEATNINFTADQGVRVDVPARDRIEVRFPGTTDSAGTANFRFTAVSGDAADSAQVSLPVYTPATTEAFAVYGVVDEGAVLQPIASPENVFAQYGGLEIITSSTALQALTDAVLYLVSYPFDCSEQIASRILAVSALRDVLSAFDAEGLPAPEEMEAAVIRDIDELRGLQNYNGGFPYWRRGRDSIPFNTVHVAYALQKARMMGFEVPEDMWQGVLYYLRDIESYYPSWYSQRTKETISAYAVYVRQAMGDPDPNKAAALLNNGPENLSLDAVSWVWQVLLDTQGYESELDAIRRHVNNQVVETAGAANFITSFDEEAYLLFNSNRRTDALLLDAIIADDPESDLIPKVVNGLLAHRTKGRWSNTQENVFVLLALDRYFDTFEAQEPDFVARIWLGDTYAGSSQFEGYSTVRYETDIPMNYLIDTIGDADTQDLIIQKEGTGRLYYRLGLRYAPTSLTLDPVDMGFVVQRVYEAVDDPEDVTLDEDGVWHIKAGARVRIRLSMVADNRRYHVALVDPLPAGLEIINPGLAVSESVPQDPNSAETGYWRWWWPWYEHRNMRDERAEVFTPLLWDGVYEYTYVARATMPGTFVAPPTKAEEMYSPEVFGRSGSDIVIVE
jgi:uncharacterized protein YfaS (alpha-2-macroglobulin family)